MTKNDKTRRIDPGGMPVDLSSGTLMPEDAELLELYEDEDYLQRLRVKLPDMTDDDFQKLVASVKASLTPEDTED